MELLAFIWSAFQNSGPLPFLLVVVVLFFSDKLWMARHAELKGRVEVNTEEIEKMNTRLSRTKAQVAEVELAVQTLVTTTDHISQTLDRHDKDERGFWRSMKRFMLYQGFKGAADEEEKE